MTFPSGQISLMGSNQALENIDPSISYIGPDGTIFYLAGPLAPVPGAQEGIVLQTISGLMSPFNHLDNQGARQDGSTWNDALYDAGEIDMTVEASGFGASSIRKVIGRWINSWDPKRVGKLSWFTPEMGEWWADVRLFKTIPDQIVQSYSRSGRQKFTWTCRNDDAFWKSYDSVSTFSIGYNATSHDFTNDADSNSLDSTAWDQAYSLSGGGTCGIRNGTAQWIPSGNASRQVVNRHKLSHSVSTNQVVSVRIASPNQFFFFEGAAFDIWARLATDNDTGVRLRITAGNLRLSYFISGTEHVIDDSILFVPPIWNETWTLVAGTEEGDRVYLIQRDGLTIRKIRENGTGSVVDVVHNNGWGWGLEAANSPLGGAAGTGQLLPAPIVEWTAADNLAATQAGFVPLSNRGDQDAWPRYLCYGPGTFAFGDGPGSNSMITFGPLEDGQIVLVTTLPRLRSVIDLSPATSETSDKNLNQFQEVLEGLISFATNNNVPPFLQQFESFFGILPPQGVLYSLLKGRFTTPIPPKEYGSAPVTSHIPVSITDGSPSSKIIAAITPQRRWPE